MKLFPTLPYISILISIHVKSLIPQIFAFDLLIDIDRDVVFTFGVEIERMVMRGRNDVGADIG